MKNGLGRSADSPVGQHDVRWSLMAADLMLLMYSPRSTVAGSFTRFQDAFELLPWRLCSGQLIVVLRGPFVQASPLRCPKSKSKSKMPSTPLIVWFKTRLSACPPGGRSLSSARRSVPPNREQRLSCALVYARLDVKTCLITVAASMYRRRGVES